MKIYQVSTVMIVLLIGRTRSAADPPNLYQFGYTVRDERTRDFKTHQEIHNGKQVRGMYSLSEPNGDLRVVTYTADATNGFRADVKVHPAVATGLPMVNPDLQTNQSDQQPTDLTTPAGMKEDVTSTLQNNSDRYSELELNLKVDHSENNYSISNDDSKQINNVNDDEEPAQMMAFDTEGFEESEHAEEDHTGKHDSNQPLFRQSLPAHSLQTPLQESQIIPIKIQDDVSTGSSDLLEYEPNFEMTTLVPIVNSDTNNEDVYDSPEKEPESHSIIGLSDETSKEQQVSMPSIQTVTFDQDKENIKNTTVSMNTYQNNENITNNFDQQKETGKTDKNVVTKNPLLESSINNSSIINTTLETYIEHSKHKTTEKRGPTDTDEIINKKNILKQPNNNKIGEYMEKLNQDKLPIMLTALLIPTSSIMKMMCFPNLSDNRGINMAPTSASNMPQIQSQPTQLQINQNPMKSLYSTTVPMYSFQIVHFNSLKSPKLKSDVKIQPYIFPLPAPMISVQESATNYNRFYDGAQPAIPQQLTHSYPVLEDTVTTGSGYSSFGIEGAARANLNQPQIGQYTPHLVPPQWGQHPFRPAHNSQHRQMPIFVLPMSHNSNFAPTFNPSQQDSFNQ